MYKAEERILITGGTGFVGSHLTKTLIRENFSCHFITRDVKALSLAKLSAHSGFSYSIYDGTYDSIQRAFDKFTPNLVVHLASTTIKDPKPTDISGIIGANITFGNYLLEAMIKVGCFKMINTGTYWQYKDKKYDSPVNLYAATKNAFEQIIKFYVSEYLINCINLILFDNYGLNDDRCKLFNTLKAQDPSVVLDMTPGAQIVNYLHIDDVVNAIIHSFKLMPDATNSYVEHYLVKNNEETTLKDVVNLYIKISKKQININWGGLPYPKWQIMQPVNLNKFNNLPKWTPHYSLEKGFKSLIKKGDL